MMTGSVTLIRRLVVIAGGSLQECAAPTRARCSLDGDCAPPSPVAVGVDSAHDPGGGQSPRGCPDPWRIRLPHGMMEGGDGARRTPRNTADGP